MSQVSCLQIFTYKGLASKFWAFKMMQFAHKPLSKAEGLSFYKLMGSGRGIGFNPWPDWSTYALLTVWESEGQANSFFDSSNLFSQYKAKASSIKCHYMKCIKSHGIWSGQSPFQQVQQEENNSNPIGVITRATIKKRHLVKFWKYVPKSTIALSDNPNLLYKKGIGEVPIIQMATFSIWKNRDAIKEFAYKNQHHKKAIAMTKKHQWYSEELFSRFEIYKTIEMIDTQ